MNLFQTSPAFNLLPCDGEAIYFGPVFPVSAIDHYLHNLLDTILWKNDEAFIFGKHFITKRKVAWYGDSNYEYTYSSVTKRALSWTKELLELKKRTEDLSEATFNSCLLNLYHSGEEGMGWHSDDEKTLKKDSPIASLSFGAERSFSLKHKTGGQKVSLKLENGSLLLMKGSTQTHWLHSLPKTKKVLMPRVNLTFRTILF